MAEPHEQPPSSPNQNVGSGVGNSVVNDLMRVYENLTQSSTPQAGVPDASKVLSMAYNNSGPPQSQVTPVYQPPAGYSIPPPVYHQQQQQQPQETTKKNPLHIKADASAPIIPHSYNNDGGVAASNVASYQQHHQEPPPPGTSGYVSVPMTAATSVPSSDGNKGGTHHTQRSGEESHTSHPRLEIVRTSSMVSKASQISSQHQQQPPADASSESDKSAAGRTRRKRKQFQHDGGSTTGSGGGKKSTRGKKSKKEDGRWSKRFTWPEDLHRDFVSAIFDVGLKHSSPSTIMEHMPKHEQITSERIKSHLQKYRLHRVKSKKEFISSYEASLRNYQQNQNTNSTLVSGGAEIAAHLTSSSLGKSKTNSGSAAKDNSLNTSNALATVPSSDLNQKQNIYQSQNNVDGNDSLMLPQLTEAEKQSPIGAAMGYLMGLFFSLKQQLMIQRSLEAAGEKAKANALFSSSNSVTGQSASTNIGANNPTAAATAAAVAAGVEFAAETVMQQPQHAQQNGVSRTNIEVNSMMKREMQNQMALQNKMRALKQQELDKYKNINKGMVTSPAVSDAVMTTVVQDNNGSNPHLAVANATDAGNNSNNAQGKFAAGVGTGERPAQQPQHQVVGGRTAPATQGAGEMAGTDLAAGVTTSAHGQTLQHGNNNNNLLPMENADDFWHTDVVDEQLFEFLMDS